MNIQQEKTFKLLGFSVEEMENLKKIPRITLYNKEGVPFHNTLADPYHLERYLKRGFNIKPPLTETQGEAEGFKCETCGKVLKTRLALAGHNRSHNTKTIGGN